MNIIATGNQILEIESSKSKRVYDTGIFEIITNLSEKSAQRYGDYLTLWNAFSNKFSDLQSDLEYISCATALKAWCNHVNHLLTFSEQTFGNLSTEVRTGLNNLIESYGSLIEIEGIVRAKESIQKAIDDLLQYLKDESLENYEQKHYKMMIVDVEKIEESLKQ